MSSPNVTFALNLRHTLLIPQGEIQLSLHYYCTYRTPEIHTCKGPILIRLEMHKHALMERCPRKYNPEWGVKTSVIWDKVDVSFKISLLL